MSLGLPCCCFSCIRDHTDAGVSFCLADIMFSGVFYNIENQPAEHGRIVFHARDGGACFSAGKPQNGIIDSECIVDPRKNRIAPVAVIPADISAGLIGMVTQIISVFVIHCYITFAGRYAEGAALIGIDDALENVAFVGFARGLNGCPRMVGISKGRGFRG